MYYLCTHINKDELFYIIAMTNKAVEIKNIECSCAAANQRKTYSATELAEMFKSSRDEFLGVNLEVATQGWNLNYIYDFFNEIGDLKQIKLAAEWVRGMWIETHGLYSSYENAKNDDLIQQKQEFEMGLNDIVEKLTERFEHQSNIIKLREVISTQYEESATTTIFTNPVTDISSTQLPTFQEPFIIDNVEKITVSVKLEDLPIGIRETILVSQEVFDVFVMQVNNFAWPLVNKNKTRYCDPLRFVCNFHYITQRETSREQFDLLLHSIVKVLHDTPPLLSSMRRCQLTNIRNINRSYLCYENFEIMPDMKKEISDIISPCQELEESLRPVLDAMKDLKSA